MCTLCFFFFLISKPADCTPLPPTTPLIYPEGSADDELNLKYVSKLLVIIFPLLQVWQTVGSRRPHKEMTNTHAHQITVARILLRPLRSCCENLEKKCCRKLVYVRLQTDLGTHVSVDIQQQQHGPPPPLPPSVRRTNYRDRNNLFLNILCTRLYKCLPPRLQAMPTEGNEIVFTC